MNVFLKSQVKLFWARQIARLQMDPEHCARSNLSTSFCRLLPSPKDRKPKQSKIQSYFIWPPVLSLASLIWHSDTYWDGFIPKALRFTIFNTAANLVFLGVLQKWEVMWVALLPWELVPYPLKNIFVSPDLLLFSQVCIDLRKGIWSAETLPLLSPSPLLS